MALIIRAAALSPVSRQLRRPTPPAPLETPQDAQPAPGGVAAPAVALPASPAAPDRAELVVLAARLHQEQQELATARAELAKEQQQAQQLQQELRAERQRQADDAESIRAEAERRGYEQGQEKSRSASNEATAAQVARLNGVVQALSHSKRALLDENEDGLVELAFTAVCRVLGATASSRPGLESMIAELISAEREPKALRVRMHPQDLTLMTSDASGLDPRLEFVPDTGIELGGCLIEGQRGTLDARLELQLQHLRATLLMVRQQRGRQEEPV